ncbi:glycosyltransferase family 2 protein [Oceanithermus sp.]|uniref:glycosyltransferase family 2 protein n=1 Tax=Oceanithermus sp. TaxID=2268145 RepID=UPI002579DF77|nr:glycosyltransferase family 2 protein [Oceanithermus sp.]
MATLFLPAYNEAARIGPLVERARDHGLDVIVVNDGSRDATAEIAAEAGARVIDHPRNLGLAQAIRTLLRHAVAHLGENDVAVFMDADGTMDPADAPAMVELVHSGEADIVIASRFTEGGSEQGVPLARRLYSRGARALYRTLNPIPGVNDYTSGYRVYRVKLLKELATYDPLMFRAPGFSAATDLLLNLRRLQPRVREVPLRLRYDLQENSKMRVAKTALEYLRLAFRAATRPDLPVQEGALLHVASLSHRPVNEDALLTSASTFLRGAPVLRPESRTASLLPVLRSLEQRGLLQVDPGGHKLTHQARNLIVPT